MASGKRTIIITTPTGNIGRKVLDKIVDSGEHIRVIARDPSKLPATMLDKVEIVKGSHADSEVANKAFSGADSVFWLCPPAPQSESVEAAYVDFTRPACECLKRQGVERVVSISALGRGTSMAADAGFVTASHKMDDLIASTGVALRTLVMPSFIDNLLRQIGAIKNKGMFFSPINGDLKLPACTVDDIAVVSAKFLLDDTWEGREDIPALGPEDISFNDMALIMSEVLGRPVHFQQIPFDAYKKTLMDNGMSEAMAQGMVDMAKAKNEGMDNVVIRNAENTTPTSFRQWCEETLKPAVLR